MGPPKASSPVMADSTTASTKLPPGYPASYKKHGQYYFDMRSVEFVLGDGTLYRVFRHSFEAHSSTFVQQYLSDQHLSGKPIAITDVSHVDFDRLLALIVSSCTRHLLPHYG